MSRIVRMKLCLAAACVLSLSCSSAAASYWKPSTKVNMFYQLGKSFNIKTDVKKNVQAYVVDGFDTPVSVVAAMRKLNLVPICYISAGSVEAYRPDAKKFPASVVGKVMNGWPDEKWLDIRSKTVRINMEKRIKMCRDKGFLAVDPDNVDGYTGATGFPLTYSDQLSYNTFLANTAHKYNLGVGLKNDLDQIDDLYRLFDFAVNEECWEYDECDTYTPFVKAKKPVYSIEYSASNTQLVKDICPKSAKLGIKTSKNRLRLDAWWLPCPNAT